MDIVAAIAAIFLMGWGALRLGTVIEIAIQKTIDAWFVRALMRDHGFTEAQARNKITEWNQQLG